MATGLIVFYGYIMEAFFGWYSGNENEWYMTKNRVIGPYGWSYAALIFCNGFAPQIFWFSWARSSIAVQFVVSIIVSIGMWLERFVIVVTSLHRDFVPSSWGMYYPTAWDYSTYFGTIGFFVMLIFLFIRVLPMISIFEMRTILPEAEVKEEHA
jgi:molybdopterin-containing oxidoreductase family membrane subunit